MNEIWRENVHAELKKMVETISKTYGIKSELRIEKGYPFLVNDEEFTNSCKEAAENFLEQSNVAELPMRMTAEDFAFISQQVPSCFFRLGTAGKNSTFSSGVHTPTFDIDESALEIGMALMAWLSIWELNKQ
jgi:metal-dependent amidase/aminoacylase/carboxypeptidase family protein